MCSKDKLSALKPILSLSYFHMCQGGSLLTPKEAELGELGFSFDTLSMAALEEKDQPHAEPRRNYQSKKLDILFGYVLKYLLFNFF